MVRRVCRELGNKKNIIVINDEAHHCYRRKPDGEDDKLTGDERKEAEKREEEARVWISGLEAVKAKIGVKVVYDLSATPFFLRGSGYPEGTLFPWVVSDFSLIDAIESGIVKVPRVPVADDSMTGEQPTYRDLWLRIRDHLPKKGRKTEAIGGEPKLPVRAGRGAAQPVQQLREILSAVGTERLKATAPKGIHCPPVFIVVCNNTNVSKLVFDYVAGWEKPHRRPARSSGRATAIFSNDDGSGGWLHAPQYHPDRQPAARIGRGDERGFQADRRPRDRGVQSRIPRALPRSRRREPDRRRPAARSDEHGRQAGQAGRAGQVRGLVSMLTEGWDANTVTHILGVRAFGTQLLCEQVVGRGLRRMSYAANAEGGSSRSTPRCTACPSRSSPRPARQPDPKPGPMPTRVRALEERIACEITFPRLIGYRYEMPASG